MANQKVIWRRNQANQIITNPQDSSSNIAGTFVFTNINKSTVDIFPKIDIFLYHFRVQHRLEFQKLRLAQAKLFLQVWSN